MIQEEKIKVGISIGDLNGIGSEIILKTFEDSRILDFCTPIIFASTKVFAFYKKHYKSELKFQSIKDLKQITHNKVNVFNVWNNDVSINFG